MVPAMQVTALAGLFRAYVKTGGSLFIGFGSLRWNFWMNFVRTAVLVLPVWPFTSRWGITGTALAITIGIGFSLPVWIYKSIDITSASISEYIKPVSPPVIASVVMAGPVLLLVQPTVVRLISAVLAGVFTYSITVYSIYRVQGNPMKDIIPTS